MNKKEHEFNVGEEIELPTMTLKVVETESDDCDGCEFDNLLCCEVVNRILGHCSKDSRSDSTPVIFVNKDKLINEEKRELPIGAVVELPFSFIKVRESKNDGCSGCIMEGYAHTCSAISYGFGYCKCDKRKDGKNVIFVQEKK